MYAVTVASDYESALLSADRHSFVFVINIFLIFQLSFQQAVLNYKEFLLRNQKVRTQFRVRNEKVTESKFRVRIEGVVKSSVVAGGGGEGECQEKITIRESVQRGKCQNGKRPGGKMSGGNWPYPPDPSGHVATGEKGWRSKRRK